MKLHKFWFVNPCIIQGLNSHMEFISFYEFFICEFFNSARERVIAISLSITKLKKQLGLFFFNTKIRQDGSNAIACCFMSCIPSIYVFVSWVMGFLKSLPATKGLVQQICNFWSNLLEDYACCVLWGFCLCAWNTQYAGISEDTKRPITIQTPCKISYQIIVHRLNYTTFNLL